MVMGSIILPQVPSHWLYILYVMYEHDSRIEEKKKWLFNYGLFEVATFVSNAWRRQDVLFD